MNKLQRIMCVDDDEDIRTVLAFSLKNLGGYEVLQCTNGQDALDKVAEFVPELVLLDVMMPVMDGPETLARLRELPSMANVPVIFLTAKATREELEDLLVHGATGIIVKPFDPVALPKDILIYWNQGRGQ